MTRTIAIRLTILVVLIAWPAFFAWLARVDLEHGPIWMFFHQIYYLPVSWIGSPMFSTEGDLGFSIHPTARAATLFMYVLVFYVVVRIMDRHA
jgi:hypothetical protein